MLVFGGGSSLKRRWWKSLRSGESLLRDGKYHCWPFSWREWWKSDAQASAFLLQPRTSPSTSTSPAISYFCINLLPRLHSHYSDQSKTSQEYPGLFPSPRRPIDQEVREVSPSNQLSKVLCLLLHMSQLISLKFSGILIGWFLFRKCPWSGKIEFLALTQLIMK